MKRSAISLTNTGAFAGIVLVNANGTSVQLRQVITGEGLVVTTGNGHNDEFMAMPTRTLEGRDSVRTVLLPVPEGTTAAEAQAKVAGLPAGACLYYRISDDVSDLLGSNQLRAIESGRNTKTLAQYAKEMRMPTGANPDGTYIYSETVFRSTFFSMTAKADVDLRVASTSVPAANQLEQAAPVVAAKTAQKPPF